MSDPAALFAPVAIIGQAAILPGAPDLARFTTNVLEGRSAITGAPAGRWRVGDAHVLSASGADSRDKAWSSAGGYVTDDPSVDLDAAVLASRGVEAAGSLDPLVRWLLHTGQEALRSAGIDPGDTRSERVLARTGAVFGNLSFPSEGMARFGEVVQLERWGYARPSGPPVDPRNHFMSGLPADLLARGLRLGAGAFALDAACASALYAIRLGCDALNAGRADVMLAGGVNRSDSLFIHIGFCALGAMSKTGQSRPFHRGADGLVPAEGCALLTLKRLADAERDGDSILGVVRGVGLSNDARGRSLLAPSEEGQARAMRSAFAMSGLEPRDVQLVECHATGTPTGDRAELGSMTAVYGEGGNLAIGSLKSNLGHLITVAGVAGVQKVLAGMAAGTMPPTLNVEETIAEADRAPFRLLRSASEWPTVDGVRRAAVSAFGFGGNNAHCIVESWSPGRPVQVAVGGRGPAPLAIVGLAVVAGESEDRHGFARELYAPAPVAARPRNDLALPLTGLRFPPNDLKMSLAQQTLMLRAGGDALLDAKATTGGGQRERTAVIVGMGADGEVAGFGLRWRMPELVPGSDRTLQDAAAPSLRAEHVIGTMPNIPANRLNVQHDIGGPSFTVSHEELSGIRAIEVAADLLGAGDVDRVLVGAAERADDARTSAALHQLGVTATPSTAAVALVVKRLADAERDGDRIYAVLDGVVVGSPGAPLAAASIAAAPALPASFGHPHAALGLLQVAQAALFIRYGQLPSGAPVTRLAVDTCTIGGASARVTLRSAGPTGDLAADLARDVRLPPPVLTVPMRVIAGADPARAVQGSPGLPAHSRPPARPNLVSTPAPESPVQRMAPAPALPPVSAVTPAWSPSAGAPARSVMPPAPGLAVQPAPARAAPVQAPAVAPAEPAPSLLASAASAQLPPASEPWEVGAAPNALLAALIEQQSRVTRMHGDFLARQASVHAAYQHAVTNSNGILLAALQGLPAGAPIAAPAVSPTPPVSPMSAAPAAVAIDTAPSPTPAPRAAAAAAVAPAPAPAAAPTPAAPSPTPAARPPRPPTDTPVSDLPGPKLSRRDLENGASNSITTIFGPQFATYDAFERVVRMPTPPLLLADRVLGIEGEAKKLGKGRIVTETDVRADSWYVHDDHIPAGVMIEAGQADLLLISWQGIDDLNRGERIYRLLGCDLIYRNGLPAVGDTLQYDIRCDGHARLGDIRMFFFHYACTVAGQTRLEVREGQAGFFSVKELGESGGVLWDAATAEVELGSGHLAPVVKADRLVLDRSHLEALADGRVTDCFGESHKLACTHTRTPYIAGGQMIFHDRVTIDPTGGPWGRGYLRSEQDITPETWFFDGHFKSDPCMPGTLMFEGCLQAMQVYMTALGHTLTRDGWRFEPKRDTVFKLRCRGQVIPTSKLLTYELFIQECGIEDGRPYCKAQVMCTVDGLKCFHADPLVIEMVPDWPLSRMHEWDGWKEQKAVAWDYRSLLACAWGKPSEAFGPMYKPFDGPTRPARLPGPPYHFMSRVSKTTGKMGGLEVGSTCEVEYDVPVDAWYFRENGADVMPFAVLLEAALQPCGWLASWTGCALTTTEELLFRNLDGTADVTCDVTPGFGTIVTTVKLTKLSKSAGMIIVGFEVEMFRSTPVVAGQVGGELVRGERFYKMDTVFGFFPPAAFENQVGVGSTPEERAWLASHSDFFVDLRGEPGKYHQGSLRLPEPMLCMLDRVTGYWPEGGKKGLGKWRAEKSVDPREWMFKAHFYQDPVQPGSLGIEAMIQLLQVHMIHKGYGERVPNPRFEGLGTTAAGTPPMTWKYRGQVTPKTFLVQTELEIVSEHADHVIAEAHLWVDGKRIYSAKNIVMRVVSGPPQPEVGSVRRPFDAAAPAVVAAPDREAVSEFFVEIPVPHGHAPTWVLPSLPMMTMAMLALHGAGRAGIAGATLEGTALRWFTFPDGPRPVHISAAPLADGGMVTLAAGVAQRGHVHKGEPFFRARVAVAVEVPPVPALENPAPGRRGSELYASGELFHGPEFAVVEQVIATGSNGATLLLRPSSPDKMLDGATHGMPHDHFESWFPEVQPGQVGYPSRLLGLALVGALPKGPVRCEVRRGELVNGRPRVLAWFFEEDGATPVAFFHLEEVLLPRGRIGGAEPLSRRAFLQGHAVPGLSLAVLDGDPPATATLTAVDARGSDWLPGTLERVYGSANPLAIAARELVGARLGVHPRLVSLEPVANGFWAHDLHTPLSTVRLSVSGDSVYVDSATANPLDLDPVVRWWRKELQCGEWPGEDILVGLARGVLAGVQLHDPLGFAAQQGRPCLYLGNHQNYIESVVFCCVMSALSGITLDALAKREHADGWLGRVHASLTSWKSVHFPGSMVFFDQSKPETLPALVAERCRSHSLLVHVEGTRVTEPGQAVQKMSSLWVDVAIERGIPIVPVAFRGGVNGARVDLPIAPQIHHIGAAILPEALAKLPYAERRRHVMAAINALGVPEAAPERTLPDGEPADVIRALVGPMDRWAGLDAEWVERWG